MVKTNPAVQLIVQTNLLVHPVLISAQLHAVHAYVGIEVAGFIRMLSVHLRQRDKRTSIHRPAFQLRQLIDRRPTVQHRTVSAFGKPHGQQRLQSPRDPQRMFQQVSRVLLQVHQRFHGRQSIAKQKSRTLQRPKEITDHRKAAVGHVFKQNRRATAFADAAMDLCRLQIRTDFTLQSHQTTVLLQISDALLKISISHGPACTR